MVISFCTLVGFDYSDLILTDIPFWLISVFCRADCKSCDGHVGCDQCMQRCHVDGPWVLIQNITAKCLYRVLNIGMI